MKTMATLFAMFFALFFTVAAPEAEAKRFASGKSYGKSYRTEPYSAGGPAAAAAAPAAKQPAMASATQGASRGLLGGLMGGILAGGLIAALFGGAFEGLQLMDILIVAAVAFLLFRFLRARQQASRPAWAGAGSPAGSYGANYGSTPAARQDSVQQRTSAETGASLGSVAGQSHGHGGDASQCPFMAAGREETPAATPAGMTESAVPFNFPPDFRITAFLEGAREHYRTLQDAWNKNDLPRIREYVAPAILAELEAERTSLEGEQHTEVLFVDAEIVRADVNGSTAELSLRFRGAYRDLSEGTGETDFIDIWHLERDLSTNGAPWLIVGIESR